MKKYYFISVLILTIVLILYGFREITYVNASQTEDYALLDVEESGLGTDMFITIGDSATRHIRIEKKRKDEYNHAPVFAELKKLNQQGFEIVNEVTSFKVGGGGGTVYSYFNHSYFFKRKLK